MAQSRESRFPAVPGAGDVRCAGFYRTKPAVGFHLLETVQRNRNEADREAGAPSPKVHSRGLASSKRWSARASLRGRPTRKRHPGPLLIQPDARKHLPCLREIEPLRDRLKYAATEIPTTPLLR